jgi:hypothetical protein
MCAGDDDSCFLLPSIELYCSSYHKIDIARTRSWSLNFDLLAWWNYNVWIIGFRWKKSIDVFIQLQKSSIIYSQVLDSAGFEVLGSASYAASDSLVNNIDFILTVIPGWFSIFYPVARDAIKHVFFDQYFQGGGSLHGVYVHPINVWIDVKRKVKFLPDSDCLETSSWGNDYDFYVAVILYVSAFMYKKASVLPLLISLLI